MKFQNFKDLKEEDSYFNGQYTCRKIPADGVYNAFLPNGLLQNVGDHAQVRKLRTKIGELNDNVPDTYIDTIIKVQRSVLALEDSYDKLRNKLDSLVKDSKVSDQCKYEINELLKEVDWNMR